MTFKEDLGIPPRLVLCEKSTIIDPNGHLRMVPMSDGVSLDIAELSADYGARIDYFQNALLHAQEKVLSADEKRPMKPSESIYLTRNLCSRVLFPTLHALIKRGDEKKLFRGRRVEEYVDQIALPGAKGFHDWLKSHLPTSYQQPLELTEDVDLASSLLDLVRLFGGKTATRSRLEHEPKGTIYNTVVEQQTNSILADSYLFSLVDLARDIEGERLRERFMDEVSSAFYREEEIRLLVNMNEKGECVRSRICLQGDDSRTTAMAEELAGINHLYKVRRFGKQPDEFVIIQARDKKHYSEMLKVIRGRRLPITDQQAARFILGDIRHLDSFLKLLRNRLTDWDFEKEEVETISPSSALTNKQIKYFVWQRDNPARQIEVVFEWLMNHNIQGSWIQYRYERNTNHHAYRMRQLLDEGVLESRFPSSLTHIDWSSKKHRNTLLQYANNMALS